MDKVTNLKADWAWTLEELLRAARDALPDQIKQQAEAGDWGDDYVDFVLPNGEIHTVLLA